ncbi:MAG: hypothetical protein PSV17_04240 [Methylotenera sp.]|uniref:hypothetical protein n=1 Tax=Methylotenera sp. TaxID=2051956 RepID=UPI002489642D|nr:hypothetical protein [Methylotenera sp.]MDI1308628.1 hypothetical protein [Methylotenera sp.]
MNWSNIIVAILEILAALVVTGLSIKFIVKRSSNNKSKTSFVSQKNNIAFGDIVAGNKTTKIKK